MPEEENARWMDEYASLIDALRGKHALDVTFMDLRAVSGVADAFIIATARSEINARALMDAATDALDVMGARYKIEGESSGRWRLIDAGNAIIHVFTKAGREFYNLERLWGDAPTTKFEDED